MIRRLSTLISHKRASQSTRENVEDRSRYYDVDNAVANSRPRSPLIDRQCLSPAIERQLQNACEFLSQRIEYPQRWNEFDTPGDLTDASPSSSHFPDLKISSFTIPDHIELGINRKPVRSSGVLSNDNENGTSDPRDTREFGVCIGLQSKQELVHDYHVGAFSTGQPVTSLAAEETGEGPSSKDESKCRSHSFNEQASSHENLTNPPAIIWNNSRLNRSGKAVEGISLANDMTDMWTIEECITSETEQEDTTLGSAILQQPVHKEPKPQASSKEPSVPPEQQMLQNSHPDGLDSVSSPVLENHPLDTYLKCQAETHAKQKLKIDTHLSPTIPDDPCERDLSTSTLTHTQSWSSRSTGGKIIIDANGLEKVMTADEERQRRLGLQRAVMEKMSGGCSAPAPNTNEVAAPHSKLTCQPTSPTCRLAGAKGQLNESPNANLDEQTQLPWDRQTKNTLVRKLSRLTLGKKKSITQMSNVFGFSAIVEAR